MKIDEEAKRRLKQFHVTEKLCFMKGEHRLYRCQFHQKAVVNIKIKGQWFRENEALVFNFDIELTQASTFLSSNSRRIQRS